MQLDKQKAALVVIDMQQSFCKPEGLVAAIGLDTTACQQVIGACVEVLASARAAGIPIFFTRYVYQPDYRDGGVMIDHLLPELAEVKALVAGSADAGIVAELSPRDGEIIIDKNRPSAFYHTDFEQALASTGRDQLIVCGVTTNCCVESTVRDASHRDLQVFVVEDACAELDAERHAVSLRTMDMLFADVISTETLRHALS
jgi:ureidoacrylate peracid hydrolase